MIKSNVDAVLFLLNFHFYILKAHDKKLLTAQKNSANNDFEIFCSKYVSLAKDVKL